jgi:hypothetical protein
MDQGANFTGETTSERIGNASVATFAKRISASWHGNTRSILKTALHCAEAFAALPRLARAELRQQLPFSAATFSKLNTIGQNVRLTEERVVTALPANFSLIYAVSKMNDEELDSAIQTGILHPQAKRADLIAHIKSRMPPDALPLTAKLRPIPYATIRLSDVSPELTAKIEHALQIIAKQPGVQILRRSTETPTDIVKK